MREAELDNDVILVPQYLGDLTCNPSVGGEKAMSVNRRYRKKPGESHFFITSILTLVISTFLLNSGGNLVRLISLASTLDAIFARIQVEGRRVLDEQT